MSELIINYDTKDREVEVCILEGKNITEFYSHNGENSGILGNIYCGIVENVVDGMQAAFVDIGIERNAFLSIKDALPKIDVAKEEQVIDKNVSEVLQKGQKLLVQIRKEPSDEKGARVSTHITLPGNYVVLMPKTDIITASQKIQNEKEREKLVKIVRKHLPAEFGAIIRTDAEGIDEEAIQKDIEDVIEKWNEITEKYKKMKQFGLIYDDHDVVLKTARDMVNKYTEKIYTNSKEIYQKIEPIALKKRKAIEYIETENLFDYFGLISEQKRIDERKVWLKCGGYIAIDKTEALTAIDVNSGKYVGNNSLEQTALSVNLEAAVEVMKQIRLKDVGGIVVVDFIDLETKEDQLKVIEIMKQESLKDRSKIDIKGYTRLNLVELTRKKLHL